MKKRIMSIGLALAAVLLAAGLVSCDTGGGGNKKSTKQSGAMLEWVTIGTVERGDPIEHNKNAVGAVLADSYQAAEIALTESQKATAISYGLVASSDKAKVEFAQIAKADQGATTAPAFSATVAAGTYTFAHEDWLVAKVTSEDGSKVNYYRFDVTLGMNSFLKEITIGKKPQLTAQYLGKPGADFASIEMGTFQTDHIMAPSVFKPLAQDEDATVSYAFDNTIAITDPPTAAPNALPDAANFTDIDTDGVLFSTLAIDFDKEVYLFIKVVPTAPTGTTRYYFMKLVFPRVGSIAYGIPKLVDPATPGSAFYVDPIWDSVDWDFTIDRANQAETVGTYFKESYGKHTTAKAKALWDDGGIWVLVDVTVNKFKKTAAGADESRPITPANQHNGDSLEIFINERYQILDDSATTDLGNQFRVGVMNDRSGETAAASNGDAKPELLPFTGDTYAKTRVALKDSNGDYVGELADAKDTGGFVIIAYAPFKLSASDNADEVFDSSGKVIDGAGIGFELQLNCNSGGGRDGILTWNGYNTIAYQNAAGYGVVTLDKIPTKGSSYPDSTTFPEITAQTLTNGQYEYDATAAALSVTSTGSSVQWFKSATTFGAGTSVGTSTTYTPVVGSTDDVSYYWAVVTAGGTSVVTNKRAKIEVGENFPDDEWTVLNPGLTAGWTTPNADGSVNIAATGGGVLFGYKFPAYGTFTAVEITVGGTVTSGDGTVPLKLISKQFDNQGVPQNSNDITTNQYMDITVPAADLADDESYFEYKIPVKYPIGAGTGAHANAYNGGIAWQTNANQVLVSNFRVVKAVFTVDAEADGSFYVSVGSARSGATDTYGNQWDPTYAKPTVKADGSVVFNYTTNVGGEGNSATRSRAIMELTTQQKNKLMGKSTIDIEVAGEKDAQTYRFSLVRSTTGSGWNTSALTDLLFTDGVHTVTAVGTANTSNFAETDAFILQMYNATAGSSGEVTIKYIKIKPNN